jgi:tetratricopeptide (TPR) repeat protein
MSSSDGTRRRRTARGNAAGRRSLWPLISVLAVFLAVFGGAYAAIALRYYLRPGGNEIPLPTNLERSFAGAAFGADATVADLKVEAERAVDELVMRFPDMVASHYVKAHLHLLLEESPKANAAWRKCLDLDPEHVDAYVSLATLELENGRHSEAIRLLRQAMACPGEDPRASGLLADALFKQGELDQAIAVLERQIRKNQASAASVALLGQCYLQTKHNEKARVMFETAAASMPESTKVHYGLAQACRRLGEHELAKQHMQRFQEVSRRERAAHAEEAKTYSDVRTMREIAAETLVDVGRIYLGQGELPRAEQSLLKASVLDDQDQDCWELLVLLYEQAQQPGKGLLACRKLCEINPNNSNYWLNVGLLSGRLARREEALAAVEKALAMSPNDPECRRVYEILQNGS